MISFLFGLLIAQAQEVDYELDLITTVIPEPEERECVPVGYLYAPTRALLRGYTLSCDVPGVQAYLYPTRAVGDEYRRRIRVCFPWDLEPIPLQATCDIYNGDGDFYAFWTIDFIDEF